MSSSVMAPIEKGWTELNALVDALGADGLTMTGADGWAVKDHLTHVAAWERSLLALLDGSDRRTAMGVPGAPEETDAINAAVWSLHRDKTPDEALAYFRGTHAELVKVLGGMSAEDLQLSYNHYQPNDPRSPDDDRPVIGWVSGDTYEHYAEHIAWINQLISESSSAR